MSDEHYLKTPRNEEMKATEVSPYTVPLFEYEDEVGTTSTVNRDLKHRRRGRQRERQETIVLIMLCSARALYTLVHFFAVLCKTTT